MFDFIEKQKVWTKIDKICSDSPDFENLYQISVTPEKY